MFGSGKRWSGWRSFKPCDICFMVKLCSAQAESYLCGYVLRAAFVYAMTMINYDETLCGLVLHCIILSAGLLAFGAFLLSLTERFPLMCR